MIHPGLIALEKWEPVEYASGYRARLAAIPFIFRDSRSCAHQEPNGSSSDTQMVWTKIRQPRSPLFIGRDPIPVDPKL